ncbi:diacylglycerol/lipid kinase family protein [Halosegnis marinus]|uniref:Diacylglycerol/lipid kinase family protein n=1 Tax=Halosegnis marinus TaxID=3034023 RepID=A0ABD5ZKJ3_9EURY|nr:YegS/Rv2252/BmrU family lipid kinase [Halosegnis sp. DT85]
MRVLVRNPNSGDRATSKRAATLAEKRGFDVRDSTARGETRTLAAEAAREPDVTQIAACGGDGTLNEVVRGVADADALDDVELGVVPAGTGNDFADNLGVRGVEHAFEVLARGERRRLDLGWVAGDERPFVNSCVGGLTAESSRKTSPAAKKRLGVLAYVLRTLAETRTFEGLELDVRAGADDDASSGSDPSRERGDRLWTGTALMVLVGNGRRFPGERMRQANMEDGLLNVVVIERAPTIDYLARGAADRLLRRGASHLTRLKVPRLDVRHAGDPATFSLDGETLSRTDITLRSRPGAMRFRVGEGYDPAPEEWGKSKGN